MLHLLTRSNADMSDCWVKVVGGGSEERRTPQSARGGQRCRIHQGRGRDEGPRGLVVEDINSMYIQCVTLLFHFDVSVGTVVIVLVGLLYANGACWSPDVSGCGFP
jgi:hypothetical protein